MEQSIKNTLGMELPERIKSYRIIKELAAGGDGVVFEALDERAERKVAMKFLRPELARERRQVKRFQNEARTAASIRHPNVVSVHKYGVHNKVPFIIMEHVDGETLREKIRRDGAMDEVNAVDYLFQATIGLAAAAQAGHVHRDIKPSNIMVNKNGRIKITDFGLARSAEYGDALTQPNYIVGTPNFISPEQATQGEVDFRADMYALGATFYYVLTGKLPFPEAMTVTEAIHAHAFEMPKPIKEICPHLSNRLCRIVTKLLAKDPEERYDSYETLLANIEYLKRNLDSEIKSSSPSLPKTSPKVRKRKTYKRKEVRKKLKGSGYQRRIATVQPSSQEENGFGQWVVGLVAAACAFIGVGLTIKL